MNTNFYTEMDEKLWKLQSVCNRYKSTDQCAEWVLYALNTHIMRNKATREFENAFLAYPVEKLEYLVRQCLNGDKSDWGILRTANRVFNEEQRNLRPYCVYIENRNGEKRCIACFEKEYGANFYVERNKVLYPQEKMYMVKQELEK